MDWLWLEQDWVEWLLVPGLAALVLAVAAGLGERRRRKRADLDDVGFMPWTSVSFFAMFAGIALLGLAARAWWMD